MPSRSIVTVREGDSVVLTYAKKNPSTGLYYTSTEITAVAAELIGPDGVVITPTNAITMAYVTTAGGWKGYHEEWNPSTDLDGLSWAMIVLTPTLSGLAAALAMPREYELDLSDLVTRQDEIEAKVDNVDADLVTHEANRATMETTLVAEHDSTQATLAAQDAASAPAQASARLRWDKYSVTSTRGQFFLGISFADTTIEPLGEIDDADVDLTESFGYLFRSRGKGAMTQIGHIQGTSVTSGSCPVPSRVDSTVWFSFDPATHGFQAGDSLFFEWQPGPITIDSIDVLLPRFSWGWDVTDEVAVQDRVDLLETEADASTRAAADAAAHSSTQSQLTTHDTDQDAEHATTRAAITSGDDGAAIAAVAADVAAHRAEVEPELDQIKQDTTTDLPATIAATQAALEAEHATTQSSLTSLSSVAATIRKYATNDLEIDVGDSTLTMFDDDGVTPLQVYTLSQADLSTAITLTSGIWKRVAV